MSLEPESESSGLAVLIVDALARARLLADEHIERAIAIATEEIAVRKAAGDYWCKECKYREKRICPMN